MAAFYWRMKGEARQAIECLRAALHYSPRWAFLHFCFSFVFSFMLIVFLPDILHMFWLKINISSLFIGVLLAKI